MPCRARATCGAGDNSAATVGGAFSVFEGLNGTGALLGTLALPPTGNGAGTPGCLGNSFCPFTAAGISFAGTARSVMFAGVANQIVFDDVTFGSQTAGQLPSSTVPEPGTTALLASGLLGVAAAARRRQRRS